MNSESLQNATLELRILMSMAWKVSHQALEQQLIAQNLDISTLQYSILRMLEHHGDATLSDLSRKFTLDPSTLVPTVDALERKGYIIRERDPSDRRRFPLKITAEGVDLLAKCSIIGDDDPLLNSLQTMGTDASGELLSLMRQLVHGLPEGEQMLQHVQSRLATHTAKSAAKSAKEG